MERRLQLQPRLQLLADMVPEGCRLADVGTDHGYLPVYLLQRRRIRGAVAADIGAEPLAHARRTAEAYGVEGIDFRLCDGLRDITPDEVDTVVIAGMGGETIIALPPLSWACKDRERRVRHGCHRRHGRRDHHRHLGKCTVDEGRRAYAAAAAHDKGRRSAVLAGCKRI